MFPSLLKTTKTKQQNTNNNLDYIDCVFVTLSHKCLDIAILWMPWCFTFGFYLFLYCRTSDQQNSPVCNSAGFFADASAGLGPQWWWRWSGQRWRRWTGGLAGWQGGCQVMELAASWLSWRLHLNEASVQNPHIFDLRKKLVGEKERFPIFGGFDGDFIMVESVREFTLKKLSQIPGKFLVWFWFFFQEIC